jgi:serine/threonine-protein kinase
MGTILRVRDPEFGRDLALKLLPGPADQSAIVRRFLDEARIAGQLQHPGVVPVHELSQLPDQRPYFTMKLVEGRTLAGLLADRSDPAVNLPRFLKVFEQVCQTLAYAHSRGVIHRDLKPSNVMVGAFGEVQIMDWGLAKRVAGAPGPASIDEMGAASGRSPNADCTASRALDVLDVTLRGQVMGTPAYMPPEQARGEIDRLDERCDVFGLGAILCEILTGKPPFVGAKWEDALRRAKRGMLTEVHGRLDRCEADPELLRLAKACLAAEPGDRPRNAGVVAKAVASYLTGVQERLRAAELERATVQARVDEARAKAAAEKRARRLTVGLAAAVVVALVLAGSWLWVAHERAARQTEELRERDRRVSAELERVDSLRDQAQLRPAESQSLVAEALASAQRANGLLDQGPAHAELRQRVQALVAELLQAERDRRMTARLEQARLSQASVKDGHFDLAAADAEYAAAFREYGIDVRTEAFEPTVERLRATTIRAELAAALDDWALVQGEGLQRQRLRDLASAADPDPQRSRVRDALARNDRKALLELAEGEKVVSLPAPTLILLAQALRSQGAFAENELLLRRAQRHYPGDFWVNHELAYFLGATRPPQLDEAIRFYTAALALRGQSPGVYVNFGVVQMRRGRLDEAITAYQRAIELKPDYGQAYCNLGLALVRRGRPDEALDACRKAQQLQPESPVAFCNAAYAFLEKGLLDDAFAACRKALELDPNYAEAYCTKGSIYQSRGQLDDALTAYQKAIQLKPALSEPYNNIGSILWRKGQPEEALPHFRRAVELEPTYANAYFNLGRNLSDLGRQDEAIPVYQKAIELNPKDGDSSINLGSILLQKGRFKEAVDVLERAVRLRPQAYGAHYNLGNAYMKLGRLDDAAYWFRKTIEINPNYAQAHCNLGSVLRERGEFQASLDAYRQGHKLGSKSPHWSYPSAEWVREAERLVELDERLEKVLRGAAAPKDDAERVVLVSFCQQNKRRFATAAHLWQEIFAATPALAEDPSLGYRYSAAGAAARAACGQGDDAAQLDNQARTSLRGQAQTWLRADLAAWRKRSETSVASRQAVHQNMHQWQRDPAFAGMRGDAALARLPEGERSAWRQLWADVAALLHETRDKPVK